MPRRLLFFSSVFIVDRMPPYRLLPLTSYANTSQQTVANSSGTI